MLGQGGPSAKLRPWTCANINHEAKPLGVASLREPILLQNPHHFAAGPRDSLRSAVGPTLCASEHSKNRILPGDVSTTTHFGDMWLQGWLQRIPKSDRLALRPRTARERGFLSRTQQDKVSVGMDFCKSPHALENIELQYFCRCSAKVQAMQENIQQAGVGSKTSHA